MKQQRNRAVAIRSGTKVASSFSRGLISIALMALNALAYGNPIVMQKIDTTNAVLSLNAKSGDLVGLHWKNPQLEIIAEPELGENFRILLPRPGYEASYFLSRDQVLRRLEKSPNRIVLHYGPLRNDQEEVNVKVAYEIRDTGSQLLFSIQVENETDRKLAEVAYGMIGGQQGIQQRLDTESLVPGGDYRNLAPRLFSQFKFSHMNIGVRHDFAGYSYPGTMSMGWIDVYNRKAGVGYYYANQDPETRLTSLYTEVHPYTKAISPKDNWPSATELPPKEPIGLTLGWVNFPYAAPGLFSAGPIALQVHEGDWHTGAKLYRAWFDRHFTVTREPNWLRNEMAWQSVFISNPEDVIVYRFNELPKLAADAKRYGVTTFEIFGWNVGGLDRGYPDYSPDPRLGTIEDFRKALSDIRRMGVHPLLFGNVQFADTSTEAFRSHLSRYAVQGRWAPDWLIWGFGEGTIGARIMGRTLSRKMAWMSPSHPQFREQLVHQYVDRIRDGADGMMLDKTDHVGFLDFNPNVPASPDRSLPQGVLATFREYLTSAREINPKAALAAENQFDRAFQYIDVSRTYMLTKDAGSMALRYTFPEWTGSIVAESPGDFAPINNALRYGLVWVLAPRHYNDSLDETLTRSLSRYVSELIRIRQRHAHLLFHGRFDDTFGARVAGDEESIRYSVFKPLSSESRERACVVVNFGDRGEIVDVSIDGNAGREATISAPFQPDRIAVLPAKLVLPPNGAAVVVVGK